MMQLEWDEHKNAINKVKHGLDFALLYDFSWEKAWIIPDDRREYGEPRFVAYGKLSERLHVVVFTTRGANIRIIGARKANARERRQFDDENTEA